MRRWWLIIALLLSVGVNVGILAALATRRMSRPERQPPPPREEPAPPLGPGQEGGGPPRASRLADRLGLEGEPRRQFLGIQRQFFEQTVRIRLHMAEAQREVRRELMSPEPDRQKIDALLEDSARDFLGLEQALAKNVVATREILDPDQEEEYLRLIARLRPLGAEGFGPRPGRRPPPWREGGRRPPRDRSFKEDGPP